MLNISKCHSLIGYSAILTVSFNGFVQAANATEQFNRPNTRSTNQHNLIAGNYSTAGGTATSGLNNGTVNGINAGTSNSQPGLSGNQMAIGRSVQGRFENAIARHEATLQTLAAAEANPSNSAPGNPAPARSSVRYGREPRDLSSCGCPNADTIGNNNSPSRELVAARAAEAEAASELAAAKAEVRQFLESVKGSNISSGSNIIW